MSTPTIAGLPEPRVYYDDPRLNPSYVTPLQEASYLRELSLAVAQYVDGRNPWLPYVTRSGFEAEFSQYHEGRSGAPSATDPTTSLASVTSVGLGYFLTKDHTTPTTVTDTSWTISGTITPRECLYVVRVTDEQARDSRAFSTVANGQPVYDPILGRVDPVITQALSDGLLRTGNTAFIQGGGTTSDPITGLAGMTFLSQTATSANLVDDFVTAAQTLRAGRRSPNAIFVSTSTYKLLRLAKSTAGELVFDPARPITIAELPVVQVDGIPNSTSTYAFVGDFTTIVQMNRLLPPDGLLYRVDWSFQNASDFNTDKRTYRVISRWDIGPLPAAATAIVKVTGIVAP